MVAHSTSVDVQRVTANGIEINVATTGEGPPVLLLHGWPFTWYLWRKTMPALAAWGYRVIAPDLRGIGGTDRPERGYDLHTLADDAAALLNATGGAPAAVVGFDIGTQIAWMLAMRHPERVRRLVVMEALIGALPGAEDFLKAGPPWWFGFHAAPGLAESAVVGNEAAYLDWFYTHHMVQQMDPATREVYVRAYSGREALRGGFEHYREADTNSAQIDEALRGARLRQPTLAIGGGVVGDATYKQLQSVSDHLVGHLVADCGHVIPEEQPEALLALLKPALA